MEKKKLSHRTKLILTGIKYAFAVGVMLYACIGMGSKKYFLGSVMELACIFLFSDLIAKKHPRLGTVLNGILILLFTVQMFVLYFGSTYLTMIMLTNISSARDLGGRAFEYILAIVLVLVVSFLPIESIGIRQTVLYRTFICVLILDLGFSMTFGSSYSPLYDYVSVGIQAKAQAEKEAYIRSQPDRTGKFYTDKIKSGTDKPAELGEKPNVILIFTEGLSQTTVEDERNIMPNVKAYESNSINFTNYFNHTAATYRGIIGQLYSGYQNNNLDTNNLVSIQEVLKGQGYHTSFINTEQNDLQFTQYLNSFGFDEVIGANDETYLRDEEAYDLLYQTVEEEHEKSEPFFTAIYTFNTHVTLDSEDQKFGDGKNAELNKFYNVDYQFGKFMEKFNASDISDNTIVVFTTDHCTYVDDAFRESFPDVPRVQSFLDRIPFFIYYKGVTPQTIDAQGRNSLTMAPTVLDFLDISVPNYFLGTTLFLDINNDFSPYDTVYTIDNTERVSTQNGVIQAMNTSIDAEMHDNINDYYAATQQERQ